MGFVLRWLTASVPEDSTPDLSYLRTAYFALQLGGGHIGLPLLILIFVSSRRVYRPASVINFCSTWVVYSVSYSMLLYTDSRPPSFTLCLAQSAMIHGAPPMAVVAGLGVVLQVYSTFQLPWQCRCLAPFSRLPHWILVLLTVTPPYLVFAAFAASAAFMGLKDPSSVGFRNRLYCSTTPKASPFDQFAVPVFCTVILGTIIAVETIMIVQYCRRWIHVKHAFPLVKRRPSISPLLRVSCFTLYTFATFAACITFLTNYGGPLPYMIQALLPLVATVVFGTQRDVFHLLLGWLRSPEAGQAMEYVQGGGWSASGSPGLSPPPSGPTTSTQEV